MRGTQELHDNLRVGIPLVAFGDQIRNVLDHLLMVIVDANFRVVLRVGAVYTTENVRTIVEKDVDLVVIEQKGVGADGAAAEAVLLEVLRRFAEVRVKQGLAEVMKPVNGHLIAGRLIHDFPEYDMYWNIPAIQFGKKVMRNYNTLIGRYEGADGMKTGFICASGFNLVASATRNNKRLIAVVLGAKSSPYRGAKAAGLLERGFNRGALSWLTPSLGTVEALKPACRPPIGSLA